MGLPAQGTDAETFKLLAEYDSVIAEHSENMRTLARTSLLSPVDAATEKELEAIAVIFELSGKRLASLAMQIAERGAHRWLEYYYPSST